MQRIRVRRWKDVSMADLKTLFQQNPFPLYRGTPLCGRMKGYMFMRASANANDSKWWRSEALVVLVDEKPILTGQLHDVPYLSEHWGMSMGNIIHLITDHPDDEAVRFAGRELINRLLENCTMDFVSVSVPAPSTMLVRALEDAGFRYAEGFANMVGTTHGFREQFRADNVIIREMKESDLTEISEAYNGMPFPSRFASDGGFSREKVIRLYVHRFREVYEKKLGPIFVAELGGRFAGALITLIDKGIFDTIGVKTNPLSGMGIIIHPRAKSKGVALNLIEHRQDYYKKMGVEYVNFGANFNNIPMIRGLTKLGLKHGSTDVSLHWRKER